jgi:hypothetical protein
LVILNNDGGPSGVRGCGNPCCRGNGPWCGNFPYRAGSFLCTRCCCCVSSSCLDGFLCRVSFCYCGSLRFLVSPRCLEVYSTCWSGGYCASPCCREAYLTRWSDGSRVSYLTRLPNGWRAVYPTRWSGCRRDPRMTHCGVSAPVRWSVGLRVARIGSLRSSLRWGGSFGWNWRLVRLCCPLAHLPVARSCSFLGVCEGGRGVRRVCVPPFLPCVYARAFCPDSFAKTRLVLYWHACGTRVWSSG